MIKKLFLIPFFIFICSVAYGVGNDSNTLLLMHMNAEPFTDNSVGGGHGDASEIADVTLDSTNYKWTASAAFDGDSGYLYYSDDTDWDVFASNSDDWTIDFWVKHTDHVKTECYICHYEDGNNWWGIQHNHGTGLICYAYVAGVPIINTTYAGEITDTNWHHIALCKVGNKYGLYKDGVQIGYDTTTDVADYTGILSVGTRGTSGYDYFDGNIDELRIQHSNYFGANPQADLSDAITVPTAEYSVEIFEVILID